MAKAREYHQVAIAGILKQKIFRHGDMVYAI